MDFDAPEANNYRSFPSCLIWLVPYLLSAAIALLWPAQGAFLGLDFRETRWMHQVPSMAAYIEKSGFASATAAYMALATLLFAPTFLVALANPWRLFVGSDALRHYLRRLRQWPVLLPVVTVAVSGMVIWGAWIQPGFQFGSLPINERRWALALAGPLFVFPLVFYYFVSGAAFAVRLLFGVFEESKNGVE